MHLFEEKYFQSSKGTIDYLQHGQSDKVLIFLHGWIGWPTYAKSFASQFPLYQIVLPYLPSHGRSFGLKLSDTFEEVIETMIEFVKQFEGKQIVIIGHSFGGAVGWRLAQENNHLISKLVVIDGYLKYHHESNLKLFWHWLHSRIYDGCRSWQKKLPIWDDPELEELELPSWRSLAARKLLETMKIPDKKIDIPILCIWGEKDYLCPKFIVEDILKSAKNLKSITVPGSHYWFSWQKQKLFSLIKEFF
jgi:pimeloyl-ACP methyl ester carboxylesterase